MAKEKISHIAKTEVVKGKANLGNVILLIGSFYDSLLSVGGEIEQNAIDAKAKKALLIFDFKEASITGYDDGVGASRPEMKNKMQTIALTTKSLGAIGERGLGFLAGIGIIKVTNGRISFISHKKGTNEPFFRLPIGKKGLPNRADVDFDFEVFKRGFKIGNVEEKWTSVATVKGIEKSAMKSLSDDPKRLDTICDYLGEKFREKILSTGIEITVRVIDRDRGVSQRVVKSLQFPGRKETVELQTKRGPVLFEMFLTRTVQKKPQIMVQHEKKISMQLKDMDPLWNDVKDLFGSGYLQGHISLNFCTRNENHTKFKWDEDYEEFIEAVLRFVTEYGRSWLERLNESKKDERLMAAARKALSKLDKYLQNNPEMLPDEFKVSVSSGHKRTGNLPDDKQKISTHNKRKKPSDVPPMVDIDSKRNIPEKEKLHTGVGSESGTKRKSLKGESGVQILFKEGLGNWMAKLGRDGEDKGRVLLNTSHSKFAALLDKGSKSKELDMYIQLLLFKVFAMPNMRADRAVIFSEEFEGIYMEFFELLC